MDWFFDNIVKIIMTIITIVYLLASRRGSSEEDETTQDPEAQVRARRIQEEIRRKILERQQENAPMPPPPPEVEWYDEVAEPESEPEPVRKTIVEPLRRAYADTPPEIPFSPRRPPTRVEEPPDLGYREEVYEAQLQRIEEQRQKADELRRQIRRDSSTARYKKAYQGKNRDSFRMQDRIRKDLRNPQTIRAAIVLREILDKPVGLR